MTRTKKEPNKIVVNEIEVQKDDLFNNNRKHIEQAKKQLVIAKEMEQEKIKQGFKYMIKDKTAKLIDPIMFTSMKKDGWRFVK
tara:strand:+ start:2761 stop:3009 length:249 start_codon:yes stop_codon:yes gene_type:complete